MAEIYPKLNGLFCIYKPAGNNMKQVIETLKLNLCRKMKELPSRPVRDLVVIKRTNNAPPTISSVQDLSDHPLVVGPRYEPNDFNIRSAGFLGKHASGVVVMGIDRGISMIPIVTKAKMMRVYQVEGKLGLCTHNFSPFGRLVQRTTYNHVTLDRLQRVVAGLQAGHQRHMFQVAGVDVQSQEAYELASRGLLRPSVGHGGPVVYGMKCIHFNPPYFTLEIHSVDESSWYLMKLVHEIGLTLRSSAVCTHVRRTRYGPFELDHALLLKHCDPRNIVDNIGTCQRLIDEGYLRRRKNFNRLDDSEHDSRKSRSNFTLEESDDSL